MVLGSTATGSVLLSWPWGSAPSWSGGPSSAVCLTSPHIVNSHAESAAMLGVAAVGALPQGFQVKLGLVRE